jgi:DNA-binding GntR family transcriptional regulator
VLADRIAAALVHHEPGWRLPRLTALARRYNVSVPEVDGAVDELAARHLLRRLPDGQVYRASPAEYLVPVEGLDGLSSSIDPMGGVLTCRSRQVSCRRVPEDTGRALQLAPGETVLVIRSLWLLGGEPGALSATYLPERLAGLAGQFAGSPLPMPGLVDVAQDGAAQADAHDGTSADGWPEGAWDEIGWQDTGACGEGAWKSRGQADPEAASGETAAPGTAAPPGPAGLPRAIQLELSLPPPSVARSLRLSAGQPVASVTVRFDDPQTGAPVALSMAMLRPDLFRIVVQAPGTR